MLRENICTHTHNINIKGVKQGYIKKNTSKSAERPQTQTIAEEKQNSFKTNWIQVNKETLSLETRIDVKIDVNCNLTDLQHFV